MAVYSAGTPPSFLEESLLYSGGGTGGREPGRIGTGSGRDRGGKRERK